MARAYVRARAYLPGATELNRPQGRIRREVRSLSGFEHFQFVETFVLFIYVQNTMEE